MAKSKLQISHDKNGRKVFIDSIVKDTEANEYFIPVRRKNQYGDNFMGDFYPLEPHKLLLVKPHATLLDLKKMMQERKDEDVVYNVSRKCELVEGESYIPRELFINYGPLELMKYNLRKWPDGKQVEINVGLSKNQHLVSLDQPIVYQNPNWYVERGK